MENLEHLEHCPGKDFPPGRARRRAHRLRIAESRAPPGRGRDRIRFYGSSNVPLQLRKEAQRLGTDAASRKMLSGFGERPSRFSPGRRRPAYRWSIGPSDRVSHKAPQASGGPIKGGQRRCFGEPKAAPHAVADEMEYDFTGHRKGLFN